MVPISFWRNSDPFKKNEHVSSSKIDKARAILSKSLKSLMENLSNPKRKTLNHYWNHDHGARVNQKKIEF